MNIYRRNLVRRFVAGLSDVEQVIQIIVVSAFLLSESGWGIFAVLAPKKM